MKAMRTVTLLLLLVSTVATLYVFGPDAVRPSVAPSPAYRLAKGDALFDSAFKQFDSRRVALAHFKGRPLVVYFWASWCVECREEIKALMALQQRHASDGLAVIAIGVDQSDKLANVTRELQIGYPVFVAGQEGIELSKRLGNLLGEIPYTAAIDRRGMFVAQQLGKLAAGGLDALAAAALQ